MSNNTTGIDNLPNWVCAADNDLQKEMDKGPHLTTYNRAIGGCSDHPWSGGCSIPQQELHKLLVEARINEIVVSGIAGVGGLTPKQQKYFEDRIKSLKSSLEGEEV